MYRIFYSPGACALASHIALVDAAATYEAVRINFQTGEQRSPDYLKINPKGRVPALATDQWVLTETPAILAYIAQAFPKARLAPLEDALAFARVQEFNSFLCSTVHVHHAHRTRGSRWADDAAVIEGLKRKVAQNMNDAFALIEGGMLKGPWVMGQDYTICDPYLFTLAGWLEGDGVDIARFPRVHDHFKRMSERPEVKRALAEQKG